MSTRSSSAPSNSPPTPPLSFSPISTYLSSAPSNNPPTPPLSSMSTELSSASSNTIVHLHHHCHPCQPSHLQVIAQSYVWILDTSARTIHTIWKLGTEDYKCQCTCLCSSTLAETQYQQWTLCQLLDMWFHNIFFSDIVCRVIMSWPTARVVPTDGSLDQIWCSQFWWQPNLYHDFLHLWYNLHSLVSSHASEWRECPHRVFPNHKLILIELCQTCQIIMMSGPAAKDWKGDGKTVYVNMIQEYHNQYIGRGLKEWLVWLIDCWGTG